MDNKFIEKLRKRRNDESGFTLMEMLIVVAIIAVLIAIAIPVFTSQLEKSRDATSIANIRSAYAEAQAAYLVGDDGDNGHVAVTSGGSGAAGTVITVSDVKIESAVADSWNNLGDDLPFTAPTDPGVAGDYTLTFTYTTAGAAPSVTMATA